MGLDAGSFEADLESLQAHGAPCILHVESEGRQRFIVCYGREAGRFVLGDPTAPGVSTCSADELARMWASRALLTLEPAKGFSERIAQLCEEAEKDEGKEYRCLGVTATAFGSDRVALCSKDRPDSLERALESYLANTQRHGRTPTFVVADDSEDPRTQQQNRRTLRRLKERYSAKLFYAGKAQKRAYAEALAQRAAVQPEITHFALLGEEPPDVANYGASRNALLLSATGEVCMQMDDDPVCEVAAAPDREDELLLTSQPDTYDLWFFDSHDEALDAVTLAESEAKDPPPRSRPRRGRSTPGALGRSRSQRFTAFRMT